MTPNTYFSSFSFGGFSSVNATNPPSFSFFSWNIPVMSPTFVSLYSAGLVSKASLIIKGLKSVPTRYSVTLRNCKERNKTLRINILIAMAKMHV
jgi:hypothetical protein